ncbi:MAG TPA: tetratricopeptide repeat protein [Polyangiaceae bacterium]|nr:tetratricopeptide repeat protein [Polyangiaceae bacterium]
MFRQVRFECGACGEGFVDWHDDDWERSAVFCVHCGVAIVAGAPVETSAVHERPSVASAESRPARALGVLKSDSEGFRDTLPGLASADASDSSRDRDTEPTLPRASRPQSASEATSTAPKARVTQPSLWASQRRTLAPIGALLLGFAAGVPAALLAENPLLRLMYPAAHLRSQLSEQLTLVSSAIDAGDWDRARDLLERCQAAAPTGDSRLATLRARLTLGLILANRQLEAGRELAAVPVSSSIHPSAADLRRVYDAWFPTKPSAAPTTPNALPVTSAEAPKAKVVVTKRELLSFARDRQHRVQLDDAERLYREILRTHPNDAEARCGLAEIQILRGGVDDGAKLFERALADNTNYLPAWVGLADVDWLRGHPERAACRYQAVIDRFPASSYPPYIVARVAQVRNSGVDLAQARTDLGAARACDR